MYCIMHKIIRLSQVICANGSRKLFRFCVRQFSGLKYYFTWEITPFRNLFSVCPDFRYIGGLFQAGFTVQCYVSVVTSISCTSLKFPFKMITIVVELNVIVKRYKNQEPGSQEGEWGVEIRKYSCLTKEKPAQSNRNVS